MVNEEKNGMKDLTNEDWSTSYESIIALLKTKPKFSLMIVLTDDEKIMVGANGSSLDLATAMILDRTFRHGHLIARVKEQSCLMLDALGMVFELDSDPKFKAMEAIVKSRPYGKEEKK